MLLDVICAVLFEKRLSSVFTRKHSRQVESARKYANHPFACNLSRIPICMIFGGLKVVLFKRETIVSDFLFKLIDREKFVHNCNRQNIHVAETTCTPASAIFYSCIFVWQCTIVLDTGVSFFTSNLIRVEFKFN